MEQYADEFERQCAALRARLATEENKSRHLEAERDALRERCEKLKAALVEIEESEDRICSYCEGEGNRYADGKAHYYSEHAPTIPCPECGGRGRLRDMDSEDMANVASAALAATEAKDCPECDGAGQQMSATPLDRCVTSLDAISRELQAVYEFARGRCCTCRWDCAHPQPGKPSCNACSNGDKGDWTPAWEAGE